MFLMRASYSSNSSLETERDEKAVRDAINLTTKVVIFLQFACLDVEYLS